MEDVAVVMAQALQGLGHLRVSDAISHGLPKEVTPLFLTSRDPVLAYSHKIVSTHVVFRALHEWVQHGWPEELFTRWYRWSLRKNTSELEHHLTELLASQKRQPTTLLVVATHFGLGHQFAQLKSRWEKAHGSRMIVVVVVTDDTPLHLWAVDGADAIIVPSVHTKHALETYHQHQRLPPTTYIVLPYMVSPRLIKPLSAEQVQNRRDQLDPRSKSRIRVSVPVSGAAVQLTYLSRLIYTLHAGNSRFFFHIVSRDMPSAQTFLKEMTSLPYVDVKQSRDDHQVVDLYEQVYEQEVIAFEITKPSEQAFKALIPPTALGGSILLFSDPVGKQERDNLAFLTRHHLIDEDGDAQRARGLRLPDGVATSSRCILDALTSGRFAQMVQFRGYDNHPELSAGGVAQFWQWVKRSYFSSL